MKALLLVAALLALGCSNDAYRPRYGVAAEIADATLSAVVMWQDALGGWYAPDVHLGCDGTEDFCFVEVPVITACIGTDGQPATSSTGTFNGCTDPQGHRIHVSATVNVDEKVATIAHEIGHSVGLKHADKGLMATHREREERVRPCIDQTTLDSFEALYDADPDTLRVTCYSDEVQEETLSRIAQLDEGSKL